MALAAPNIAVSEDFPLASGNVDKNLVNQHLPLEQDINLTQACHFMKRTLEQYGLDL